MPLSITPPILIRARALTGFPQLVARHGGDCDALFNEAGISPHVLAAPDAPFPLARMVALFDAAAVRLQAPDFGLQLAQLQDIDVLGAVALIARHSATVGEACAAIARNMSYHTPGLQMSMENDPLRPGMTRIRFDLHPQSELPWRQLMELCLGVAQGFLTMATQDDGADWHISFRHYSPLPDSHYEKYFSGQVRLAQSCNSLSLPNRLLQVALAPEGAALQMAAERHVSNIIRRFPLDLAQQVELLVERLLPKGGSSLVQIARQLGLHERTLQRRLKEQDVYFEDIVDRVRRRRAEQYLGYQAIPLAQVAAMLGYTEQSSFIRGCKRWFGTTPQAYRGASAALTAQPPTRLAVSL